MKQMFDMSEKLISEQSDEIYGVKTINWEDSSWKYLSLMGDEQVISLQLTRFTYFKFCVMSWKDVREPTVKCCRRRKIDVVQKFITMQSFGHN